VIILLGVGYCARSRGKDGHKSSFAVYRGIIFEQEKKGKICTKFQKETCAPKPHGDKRGRPAHRQERILQIHFSLLRVERIADTMPTQ
jgi:hypothetical protein